MAYRKIVAGAANQSNETASNNKINRIDINGLAWPLTWLIVFGIVVVVAATLYMAIEHGNILSGIVTGTFVGLFVIGWLATVQWLRRDNSNTYTLIKVNKAIRLQAERRTKVLIEGENYVLYEDENGRVRFQGTVQLTENRHYPAQIEAPKERDASEVILTMHDGGSSGRTIERYLNTGKAKDEKISYHQIQKILNLYRPGWQERGKKVIDAQEYPVEE